MTGFESIYKGHTYRRSPVPVPMRLFGIFANSKRTDSRRLRQKASKMTGCPASSISSLGHCQYLPKQRTYNQDISCTDGYSIDIARRVLIRCCADCLREDEDVGDEGGESGDDDAVEKARKGRYVEVQSVLQFR